MSSTPHAAVAADNLIATPAFDRWFSKAAPIRSRRAADSPARRHEPPARRRGRPARVAPLLPAQGRRGTDLRSGGRRGVRRLGARVRPSGAPSDLADHRARYLPVSVARARLGRDCFVERILGAGERGKISVKSIDVLIGSPSSFSRARAEVMASAKPKMQEALPSWLATSATGRAGPRGMAGLDEPAEPRLDPALELQPSIRSRRPDRRAPALRRRPSARVARPVVDVPLSALRVREWYLGLPPYDVLSGPSCGSPTSRDVAAGVPVERPEEATDRFQRGLRRPTRSRPARRAEVWRPGQGGNPPAWPMNRSNGRRSSDRPTSVRW